MQEQVEDQDLAGLARPRAVAPRPTASADATVLAPVPAPLDCPYLHLDDDGPSCLALAPAIRLSRRQVEIVCAGAAHVSCPRLIKADAGRVPVQIDPPPAIARRRERPPVVVALPVEPAAVGAMAADALDANAAPVEPVGAAVEPPPEPTSALPPPAASPASPAIPADPGPAPERTATPSTARVAVPGAPATPGRFAAALSLARVTARTHIVIRPATAIAWVILLATLVIVIALLTARGGLILPAASPSAGLAGASPSAASASPTTAASPSPTLAPTASPSPSPSPSPSASPSASPSPSASSPFTPEQLAVLTPCPGKPGCYQYRIKSNDNLRNLATFFGVTYPALLAANPQITNPSIIHVGERVTIPIPKPSPTKTPKP